MGCLFLLCHIVYPHGNRKDWCLAVEELGRMPGALEKGWRQYPVPAPQAV